MEPEEVKPIDFERFENFISTLVSVLIPLAKFNVTTTEDRKKIYVTLVFSDPNAKDYIGLLFGHSMSNLQAIMQLLRSQQILPHDRYIELKLEIGNETQVFLNKDVSKYRKQDYVLAKQNGASEDEAAELARRQSEKRRLIRVQAAK